MRHPNSGCVEGGGGVEPPISQGAVGVFPQTLPAHIAAIGGSM